MANRLRTGIDVLDRKLDGGLPAGSMVVLEAHTAGQAEVQCSVFDKAGHFLGANQRTGQLVIINAREITARTGNDVPA